MNGIGVLKVTESALNAKGLCRIILYHVFY